jgi:hypothetical protein
MPNLFAYAVLLVWPLVALKIKQKFLLEDAVVLLIIVPYLLLPVNVGFDPPLLPSFDKSSITSIVAFLLFHRAVKAKRLFAFTKLYKLCIASICSGIVITVLTNSDPLVFAQSYVPGLRVWDLVGILFEGFTDFFVPFYLGYHLLNTANAHRRLVYWIAALGLIYMLPIIWEARMSPQLHTQFYGFFPHNFLQQMRGDGFRPVVFLGHGLLVAFFTFSACVAAATLMKNKVSIWKFSGLKVFLILLVGVFVCKTLGVLFYLILGLGLMWLVKPQKQFLLATLVGLVIVAYPLIRENVEPNLRSFNALIKKHQEDRAQSFEFRLDNESELLAKANQRPWFGWGTWGRNHIYNEAGGAISVADGVWIIVFSTWGWVGYIGFFGLLCTPFILWYFLLRRASKSRILVESSDYSAALGIILLCNLIDFIPNSSLSHLTLLIAGALIGRAIFLQRKLGEVKSLP